MSFWAQRLGTQQPAQQAPPPPPAPTQPWWQPRPATPPAAPQQPYQQAPQQPQQQSVPADGKVPFGDLLQQDGYTTEKAQSARDSEPCPDCGSPNYIAPKGHPNAMKQCFECGYNPRFAHSTAGASGIGQNNVAPPKAARVQTGGESNFNPGTIVGRVG